MPEAGLQHRKQRDQHEVVEMADQMRGADQRQRLHFSPLQRSCSLGTVLSWFRDSANDTDDGRAVEPRPARGRAAARAPGRNGWRCLDAMQYRRHATAHRRLAETDARLRLAEG